MRLRVRYVYHEVRRNKALPETSVELTNWHDVVSRKILNFMNKAPETSHHTVILWMWN